MKHRSLFCLHVSSSMSHYPDLIASNGWRKCGVLLKNHHGGYVDSVVLHVFSWCCNVCFCLTAEELRCESEKENG